ncbi:MAG: winged helix-turn-helix transcriptional regulator [Bacteroidales bacterium]|nr:winged helix-turn-helix transcriptional regulator [Bacteroidales bacterium]
MLNALITSKTRLKIILKFFLNSDNKSYLRSLAKEFDVSTNSIRQELDRFEEANLLSTEIEGNKKYFRANTKHPLYNDIHNIVLKQIGFDQIIDEVIMKLGKIIAVFVTGDFAKGKNNKIIDLLFIADKINKEYLNKLIDKAEKLIKRKIRYIIFNKTEFDEYIKNNKDEKMFLLWKN